MCDIQMDVVRKDRPQNKILCDLRFTPSGEEGCSVAEGNVNGYTMVYQMYLEDKHDFIPIPSLSLN